MTHVRGANHWRRRFRGQPRCTGLALLLLWLVACASPVAPPIATPLPPRQPDVAPATPAFVTGDRVSLQQSTVTWDTYAHEVTEHHTLVDGSYDGRQISQQTFDTWVLENAYLRVTLLPDYGGRILSIVYKPTGHDQLYQNPVGVPYQIGTGVFYYDWLMVYGGIFPTFPEPEHGKTWLLPWDFQVVSETDQEVTVSMSIKDDVAYPAAPNQYDLGATGLELTYYVTLQAGRAALDTRIQITNPGEDDVRYEYWTNVTLAPGSDPLAPRTTAGAEIIAPVDMIKIPRYWTAIAAQENATGLIDVYDFVELRHFQNWPDMGIAYAFPDMQGQNFWGVINHDNEEGLFRIADNSITPGLKLWTWGYPHSTAVDPRASADESRPYVELWAGVSREFWQRASLPAGSQLEIWETYIPSVGLPNVTHANEAFLVNLTHAGATAVECQLFGAYPDQTVQLALLLDGEAYDTETVTLDPASSTGCSTALPAGSAGSTIALQITSQDGDLLFEGELPLNVER